jgi:protoporphyrinogen oxidase
MINKTENKIGTFLTLTYNSKNEDKMISDYITEIQKLKKYPFSNVFIKIPIYVLEKFLNKTKERDLVYKELQLKDKIAIVNY